MICAGIDAGSRTIKMVLLDSDSGKVLGRGLSDQGVEQSSLAQSLFESILNETGIVRDEVRRVVATGYGRNAVEFADTTITEITCHARGVRHLAPATATIVDIGGEDSKLIRLDGNGKVRDFAMNDRCAAGTGRFLEVVAERLATSLDDLGAMAARSRTPAAISSMCVVFAETEIIGLLAAHTPREDIAAGVQAAIAARVAGMAGRKVTVPIVFTGGVALVSGMKGALESVLEQPVEIAPDPQMTGALGAALLAANSLDHSPFLGVD
ncbi:MAG: 2-hydroxyglutaryl-CoA dehydratase [Sedimentisphaerales bacterium]|nr:2-hydroxyglutaryl-CoA dehydratase [Sedimentisphaerales bacterium]